jgi:hypothetical protein
MVTLPEIQEIDAIFVFLMETPHFDPKGLADLCATSDIFFCVLYAYCNFSNLIHNKKMSKILFF